MEGIKKTAKAKAATKPKAVKPVEPVIDETAELKQMVLSLMRKVETMENVQEAKELESQELNETIYQMKQGLGEREATGEVIERDGEILYDPYSIQNPFTILSEIPPDDDFPNGQVLGWKSPEYRKKRGWRGWIPIEYRDKYAGKDNEILSNYIPDPPERMIGPDTLDKYVRRADLVLSRLDKSIAEVRAKKRVLLAKRKQLAAGSGKTEVLRDGVEIVGKGATVSKNPRKEFEIAPSTPMRADGKNVFRTTLPITRDDSEE